MDDSQQTEQIAHLQANMKNLCRSMDEVKLTVVRIKDTLDEHRILSAERAAMITGTQSRLNEHEGRIKKLETSFVRLAIYVALGAGGATLGIDKIMGLFK